MKEADASTKSLTRNGPPWCHGFAALIQAGLATLTGNDAAVGQHLQRAAELLKAAELVPFYMAAIGRRTAYGAEADARRDRAEVEGWLLAKALSDATA